MSVNADTLRLHLDYTAWASRRLVEAAGALPADQLTRDFGTADRGVLGTLVHVYAADRIWLGRIQGNPPARFLDPQTDMRMAVLENEWPVLQERWRQWAVALDNDSIGKTIDYKDLKGNSYETSLWKIVLHVVNHGTHHRGQVSGFLRSMGHVPPALDLMAYYRQLAA